MRLLALCGAAAGLLALGTMVFAAMVSPRLPGDKVFHAGTGIDGAIGGPANSAVMPVEADDTEALASAPRSATRSPTTSPALGSTAKSQLAQKVIAGTAFLRTAFLVQSDPRSVHDFRAHASDLDLVFPDFYECTTADGKLSEWVDPAVGTLLSGSRAAVMPRLCNADNNGVWHDDEVVELFQDEEATGQLCRQLVASLKARGCQGLDVDFESLPPEAKDPYLDFLGTLGQALHAAGMTMVVDVPLNDKAFDYEQIGKLADLVVVMAYDEHFPTSAPGSVASMPWFVDGVEGMATRIPGRKLLAGIGAYGYHWTRNPAKPNETPKPADALSFAECMLLATDNPSDIETLDDERSPFFSFTDASGSIHDVHFLDAVTAWNQSLAAQRAGLRGLSLWRMGLEEPGVWGFLGNAGGIDAFDPRTLATIGAEPVVRFRGDGEMLRALRRPADGTRRIDLEGTTRNIEFAAYKKLPQYFSVERRGRTTANAHKIALTFDDGPDATYTPPLLDTLAAAKVHATFFVVGQQAEANPELLRRELAGGHVIGNHTYSHPDIESSSDSRIRVELNTTQRLIEGITGRQSTLFRAPFDVDTVPNRPGQLQALAVASELGYVTCDADIDPTDYRRLGTDRIVAETLSQLEASQGHVILLHDGGGDRSQTLAAVAKLIPALRARGYEFVTIADLLESTPAAIMPPAPKAEQLLTVGRPVFASVRAFGWRAIQGLFLATTIVAILRISLLGALVLLRARRRKPGAPFAGPVTVIVPAYNEQSVIARTLNAVLASDYPGELEVLVVDDGSKDATADRALAIASNEPRVRVIRKPNGGKSSALNLALERAQTDIVITIDADTLVLPRTVRALVAPFSDPGVTAVCGNVLVGNVSNLLTAFQDVEYVTSQNYDRRAFEAANCISVVPGATGAWRRQAVLDVGGYSHDTLTEDADLTLTILRAGGRIAYAEDARSVTEAPHSTSTLFKQRFRWSYGTYQCLWKHRAALGRGTLGWLAMPNMLFFQVLFPILSPIGDAVLLLCLIRGDWNAAATGYLSFLAMDLVGSTIAFRLEGRRLTNVATVLIQRFFYRQFMYVVAIRSMFAALRGRRHGWNKLDRLGTVRLAPKPTARAVHPTVSAPPSLAGTAAR